MTETVSEYVLDTKAFFPSRVITSSHGNCPVGIVAITLKSGLPGRAKIQAKAKGANLQTPALPLLLPVTAQLVIVDGESSQCWQTTFTTTKVNDTLRLKAVGP